MVQKKISASDFALMRSDHSSQLHWLNKYPQELDWHKTYEPRPLHSILDDAARLKPQATCTHFLGQKLSYSDIHSLVIRAASGLQKHGISPGVKVGLLLPNCPTFIIYYFAVLKLGATVVNYNPLYSHEELRFQVENSTTKLMITLDLVELFKKVEALIADKSLQEAIICSFPSLLPTARSIAFRLLQSSKLCKPNKSRVYTSLIPEFEICENNGVFIEPKIDPNNDIAVIQYSGGTTGVPKGIMLTHANIYINTQQVVDWSSEYTISNQRIFAILPFFHVFGMTVVMNYAIRTTAEIVLMPRFDLEKALRLIKKYQITIMPGVPTLFNAIVHHPKLHSFDLSSLQFCFSGGASLPLKVKQKFENLTNCKLIEGYGLSETSPVVAANPINGAVKNNSIGQPLPQTIITLRNLKDSKKEVPIGEKGELCIAGPQVMKGYWQETEMTDDVFVDEFFRTGDVGIMDKDGFIFIVDRIKDLIISSGYNVYPRRIEEVLYTHPDVQEAAVIGIKDNYKGEVPKAFVQLRQGALVTKQELTAYLTPKLAKLEIPMEIEFRDQLPMTMLGKPSKQNLRN
ncbi:MAG TPA: Long-chain-fatty-acid--CoA ligase [Hyphomicrobiaceae bacterium MAG_BT-2024]